MFYFRFGLALLVLAGVSFSAFGHGENDPQEVNYNLISGVFGDIQCFHGTEPQQCQKAESTMVQFFTRVINSTPQQIAEILVNETDITETGHAGTFSVDEIRKLLTTEGHTWNYLFLGGIPELCQSDMNIPLVMRLGWDHVSAFNDQGNMVILFRANSARIDGRYVCAPSGKVVLSLLPNGAYRIIEVSDMF